MLPPSPGAMIDCYDLLGERGGGRTESTEPLGSMHARFSAIVSLFQYRTERFGHQELLIRSPRRRKWRQTAVSGGASKSVSICRSAWARLGPAARTTGKR